MQQVVFKDICSWLQVNERFTDVIPWARLSLLQTEGLNLKAYGEELHWSAFIKHETTTKAHITASTMEKYSFT